MRLVARGTKGKSPRKSPLALSGELSVLFPGPEGWELWTGIPRQPVCAGPAPVPGQLRPANGCVLSLPARSFFSVPLWVPVVEDSPAREQTQIKLEMKGVLGANPETAVWNFEAVRREQLSASAEGEAVTRQLEATAVLASPFREEWLVDEATRYEPAGRMLPAPGSGSVGVLRRELGRWVADFYQGGKWLHTQSLLSQKLDAAAAVELEATAAQLEGEGALSQLDGWLVRDAVGSLGEDFRKAVSAPVRFEERTPPVLPKETWNLPPPALTELRAERVRGAQKKKLIRTALLGYAVILLAAAGFFIWPLAGLKLAQRDLGKIGVEAGAIRATAMLWREAGAWLDPRRNALELLWQVSRPLIEEEPPKIEGVRLTLFDLNPKRLLLQGEGKDLERVEKYFQWLKNDPAFAGFDWKHPQPRLLPNGNAQFQAEGIPPGALTDQPEGGTDENPDAP